MKSGRFIGVMSGTSLDGVDVVLAAINENLVAQQASLTYPIPIAIKDDPGHLPGGGPPTLFAAGASRYAPGTPICRCGSGIDGSGKA